MIWRIPLRIRGSCLRVILNLGEVPKVTPVADSPLSLLAAFWWSDPWPLFTTCIAVGMVWVI
ncbi:hypothetical protein ABQE45_08575 [Mycobacteroides chelonae]